RTAAYLRPGAGLDQRRQARPPSRSREAGPGRIALTWSPAEHGPSWTTAPAFGSSRSAADTALDATLKRGDEAVFDAYRLGWRDYASRLTPFANATPLFFHSAEVIKMAEDKLHPGAIVASLARPWGDT